MISVIIPLLNNEAGLKRTLASLVPEKEGQEIVVVDGGSMDGSTELARSTAWAKLVKAEGSRAARLNAGAAKAKGEILLFLEPGVVLERGWPAKVEQAASRSDFAVGCFRLSCQSNRPEFRLVEWGSHLRTALFKTARRTQALFVKAADGGEEQVFPEVLALEDLELCRRLTQRGKLVQLNAAAINPPTRWERFGLWKCLHRDAQMFWRWRNGESTDDLVTQYGDGRIAAMLFAAPDEPGKSKAWMGARLGEDRATRVYRDGISHIVKEVHRSDVEADAFVFFRPKKERAAMRRWIGSDAMLIPETGKKTVERRQNAIQTVLGLAYDKLLVLGVHCPAMTAMELKNAVIALDTHDVVVGPTDDGGCYLVGIKQAHPDLFEDLSWSADGLFEELTAAAGAKGLSCTTLPVLHDFDSEDDLGYAWAMGYIQD